MPDACWLGLQTTLKNPKVGMSHIAGNASLGRGMHGSGLSVRHFGHDRLSRATLPTG